MIYCKVIISMNERPFKIKSSIKEDSIRSECRFFLGKELNLEGFNKYSPTCNVG